MNPKLQPYVLCKNLAAKIHVSTVELKKDATGRGSTLEDVVDTLAVLNKCEELLFSARKEITKAIEFLEKLTCLTAAHTQCDLPIRGELATGRPKTKIGFKLPEKDSDEYYALLVDHLGLDRRLAESRVVVPHWPHMQEYLDELQRRGEKLPPGVSVKDSFTRYEVSVRVKSEIGDLDTLLTYPEEENEDGQKG